MKTDKEKPEMQEKNDKEPEKKKQTRKQIASELRQLANIGQLGVTMFVCILIGVLVGRWLDVKLGTSPWLLFVFCLLGGAAAIKYLIDQAKKG